MRVFIIAIPFGDSLPPLNPRYLIAGLTLPAIRSGNGYRIEVADVISLLQAIGADEEADKWRSQSASWSPEIRDHFVVDRGYCHLIEPPADGVEPNITLPGSEEFTRCSDCVCPACQDD